MSQSWNKDAISCLIENYKNYPCLYDIKSRNYHNKFARQKAVEEIATFVSVLRPNTTTSEIKSKFANLRNAFSKEKLNLDNSKRSGVSTDEVYVPSLWYFKEFFFIPEHIVSRKGKSNLDFTNTSESQNTEFPGTGDGYGDEHYSIQSNFVDVTFFEDPSQPTIGLQSTETTVNEIGSPTPLSTSTQNLPLDNSSESNYEETRCNSPVIIQSSSPSSLHTPALTSSRPESISISNGTQESVGRSKGKKRKIESYPNVAQEASSVLSQIRERISEKKSPDFYDGFGSYVAGRLRNIKDDEIRIEAEDNLGSVLREYVLKDLRKQKS